MKFNVVAASVLRGSRLLALGGFFLSGCLEAPAVANVRRAAWEGYWATNKHECRPTDLPSAKTLIDLQHRERGRARPLFDQYEHHCEITGYRKASGTTILRLACFEFWEDFQRNKGGAPQRVKVQIENANAIIANGEKLIRCRP